ncbi:hypothetical protein ALC57_02753 [Trachymyrmex cornetzi]|uniref:SWIM-type domain-containing protein n=1 Tax=Trachymyrmex cornetzi TaxID=471704 RepID=A0A195EIK1_9HYME|nr:hypothetical protein ALC57_02753 [Trachymyrmex cornetzi]
MYSILLIHTFYRAEGENYGDSAVGFVELKREGCFRYIQGKVCPEHRVNSKLYLVLMLVDEENEKIEYVKCDDCAASAGGCKHAIAFLMWVHCRSEEPKSVPVLLNNNRFLQILLHEMEKIKFDCQLSRYFIQFVSNKGLSVHALMLRFCNTNTCKDADDFLSFASIEMATRSLEDIAKDRSKSIYNVERIKIWQNNSISNLQNITCNNVFSIFFACFHSF